VHLLPFVPTLAGRLPALIQRAAEAGLAPFAQLAAHFGKAIADTIDWGQQLSVLCIEDLPLIMSAEIERETAGSFVGPRIITDAHCRDWPRGRLPRDWRAPVTAAIPTLLVSGALDPATPPEFAEAVARGLRATRSVVVPRGSHMGHGACIELLAGQVIESRIVEGLDTACLGSVARPPFARRTHVARIERTQPIILSADETADVGEDDPTPVREDSKAYDNKFTDRIDSVTIDVKEMGPGMRARAAQAGAESAKKGALTN
jgi:hypothetical protein